jgi:hypothetical protein
MRDPGGPLLRSPGWRRRISGRPPRDPASSGAARPAGTRYCSSHATSAAISYPHCSFKELRMRRREFIAGLGTAAAWPLVAQAQQPALPVIGFVSPTAADASAGFVAAFRKGLGETGYVDGRNVTVEYHWLEGQYERLPALIADLIRRRVAVLATPGNSVITLAAKAATATIPIIFCVGQDPVQLRLVASLPRPGGNATGVNFFSAEVVTKRLGLLHELVPKAVRVAVLVNPANAATTETVLRDVQKAARAVGLQILVLNASMSRELDEAFAPWRASSPMPSSLLPTGCSTATLRNLSPRRRAPGFRLFIRSVGSWKLAG